MNTSHLNDFQQAMTGNVTPLLHEIRHALQRLIETEESTTIDLRALPMAPGEMEKLETILGSGEVSAKLNALGPSEIVETSIAGVWLVTHYNMEEEVLGKYIEITSIPDILTVQPQDLHDSLNIALPALLEENISTQ
jgi:hydrogenase-1 operon protein HyaF